MNGYRFIGGSKHGEIVNVQIDETTRVPLEFVRVHQRLRDAVTITGIVIPAQFIIETYQRRPIADGSSPGSLWFEYVLVKG